MVVAPHRSELETHPNYIFFLYAQMELPIFFCKGKKKQILSTLCRNIIQKWSTHQHFSCSTIPVYSFCQNRKVNGQNRKLKNQYFSTSSFSQLPSCFGKMNKLVLQSMKIRLKIEWLTISVRSTYAKLCRSKECAIFKIFLTK